MLKRHRPKNPPPPPENVRLINESGDVIPLECRYDGIRDGLHVWTGVLTAALSNDRGSWVAVMDVLPAKTQVRFQVLRTIDSD